MSLLTRFLLFVALALMPALAIELYNEADLRTMREREVHDQARRLLHHVESEHARIVEGVRELLGAVVEADAVRDLDAPAAQAMLSRLDARLPAYMDVHVVDRDGMIIAATDRESVGIPVQDRAHVRDALDGAAFAIGDYIETRAKGAPALPFATPSRNADGRIQGAVTAVLDLGWLDGYLAQHPLPAGVTMLVADRNGTVLAYTKRDTGHVGKPLPPRFLELLDDPVPGLVTAEGLDGTQRLVAYSPVRAGVQNLFLSVGLDAGAALTPIDDASRRAMLTILTVLALTVLAAALAGRTLVHQPVRALLDAAGRWRAGDLSARTGLTGTRSEFGVLAAAFDDMADALAQRERDREAAHAMAHRVTAVFDSITDSVLEVDAEWRLTFMNRRGRDLVCKGRDFTGRRLWDVFPGAAGTVFWDKLHQAMAEQSSLDFEAFCPPFGRWFGMRAFPSQGGLAVYFQDVSERRAAEHERQRIEQRHRAIVETAVDALIVIDARGGIQSFNPAAERIFGYAAAEVLGQNVSLLMPEGHQRRHDGYIDNYRATGERKIIGIGRELEGRRKDGSTVPLELSITEWAVEGERYFTGIMRDITRRVEAAEALRQSEAFARGVVESSADCIKVLDLQGNLLFMNGPGRCAMEVEDFAPFCGQAWASFWPVHARAEVQGALSVARGGGTGRFVAFCPTAKGTPKWWDVVVSPVLGADGKPERLISISRDISDAKRSEAAVRSSELQFRTLADSIPQLAWMARPDGYIFWYNQRWHDFTGMPLSEVQGLGWRKIQHPDHEARVVERIQACWATGEPWEDTFPMRGHDGTYRWFLSRALPIRDEEGNIVLWFGTNTDVTEQQEAAGVLEATTERLRIALDAAAAGTWDWDIVNGRTTWSDEYFDLYGLDRATTASGHEAWAASVFPEDREHAMATLERTLRERRTDFRIEFRVRHPQRGVRWLAGFGRAVYAPDGTPLRMSGLNMDITERKAMEQALETAKEDAERANLSKTKFLAAASHDLRQPVQSLMLFAGVLADQLEGRPEAVMVEHMQKATDGLKQLLDGLLDISRLDAGVITPKVGAFALGPLLAQLAAEYQPRAAQKGLRLRVVPSRAWVRSDPGLLERMLRNLIENAIRYTDRGSILIGCRARPGRLQVQVVDTGVGIPLAKQRDIFEEFVQVGNAERDRAQGLGLGLAIVRRLSSLLHHPLGLKSRPGHGSCFTLDLPTAVAQTRAAADPGGADAVRKRTVLVVDDEAIILMGLKAMLEGWGYRVVAARGQAEALDLLASAGVVPDVAMADYRLGNGQNGPDVLRSVQAACGRPVPSFILTGDTDPARIVEARNSGFGLLHKPVTARELRKAIEATVAGRTGALLAAD